MTTDLIEAIRTFVVTVQNLSTEPPILVTIPGIPIPLQRHRLARGRMYDPTSEIKKQLSYHFLPYKHRKLSGPLFMYILFGLPIPKSCRKMAEHVPHDKRPDTSNLTKLYEDVMNKLLYNDDAQIALSLGFKQYSTTPGTCILLSKLDKIG